MVRTRPTAVGRIFLLLMFLFYTACVTSQSGLLLLFIGLIGGCFTVNWSFSRRNVRNVLIEAPRKEILVEGSSASQPWQITNRTSKHIELTEILSDTGQLFSIPMLPTEETLALVPDLIYQKRGVYTHKQIVVCSTAPYGLLRSARKVELKGEVVVLPKIYETASPETKGLDLVSGGKIRGRRRVNSGTDFAGIRGWQAGDTVKQIHWKSTARRNELMVKTFEEELGGRISIIIDGRATGGRKTKKPTKSTESPKKRRFGNKYIYIELNPDPKLAGFIEKWFGPDEKVQRAEKEADSKLLDNCLRAAGSLGTAALQEGHHVEIVESISVEPFRLAPFSDEGELLERLARYQPNFPCLEIESLWRKSSIILFGLEWHPEWNDFIAEAQRQHREVSVYLPENISFPRNVGDVFWFSDRDIIPADEEELATQC
jgi:hypothetical protein